MSDIQFRELERIINSEPHNGHAWADYLTLGARLGKFDPQNFASLVTFLFKITPPTYPSTTTQNFTRDRLNQYYESQNEWFLRCDEAERVLHLIRTSFGQWSAQQFADHINKVFPQLYKNPSVATVQTQQDRLSDDQNGGDIEGPEDVNTDVVFIDEWFIHYEELEPSRSLIDFNPLYTISTYSYWTEAHGEQMSDPVVVKRLADPHQVILYIIHQIQGQLEAELGEQYWEKEMEEHDDLFA